MIKIGINAQMGISPNLVRMLAKHPDVEIRWITSHGNYLRKVLCDELKDIPAEPIFDDINLYIGPETEEFTEQFHANQELKAILILADDYSNYEIGLPEYNRKALVRGARAAYTPQIETMLGALALMPLAKNLLLNATIYGTLVLPNEDADSFSAKDIDSEAFDELRENVLVNLQQSFSAPFKVKLLYDTQNTVAKAVFTFDCHMSLDSLQHIYKEFYHDHRHVSIVDDEIINDMVIGTNKTAISLDSDGNSMSVAVAFDALTKMDAALYVHIMDLLFGLHECAGI